MLDAFDLFHISWLKSDLHNIYEDEIQDLHNNIILMEILAMKLGKFTKI